MIIEFILSLLVLSLTATICSLSSGGYVWEFLEPVLLPGIIVILVLMISLSGYGKSFLKIFSSPKKIKETDLSDLKKIETVLNYSFKALALICIFFMFIAGVYFYLNFYDTQTLGPNLATMFCSLYYLAFFGMVIFTLKGKLRIRIINFMTEETEPEEKIELSNKQKIFRIVKIIITFALIAGLYYLIVYSCTANNVERQYSVTTYLIDAPGLIYIFFTSFLLLAISGNFKKFLKTLKFAAKNTRLSVSQKAISLNAIHTLQVILILDGIMCSLGGYMATMVHLENKEYLGINILLASLPMIYSLIINLILLALESKISLLGESE